MVNLVLQAVSLGVAVPVAMLVTRELGAAGRGEYALVTMASAVVALVAGGGWADVAPTVLRRGDGMAGLRAVRLSCLRVAVPVSFGWSLSSVWIFPWFGVAVDPSLAILVGVLVLLGAVWALHVQAGAALGWPQLPSLAEAVRVVLYGIGATLLYASRLLSPESAILAFTGAYLLAMLIIRPRPSITSAAEALTLQVDDRHLASHAMLGRVLEFIATRSDVFLVAALLDIRHAGLYSASIGLAELLGTFGYAAAGPVLTRIVMEGGMSMNAREFLRSRTTMVAIVAGTVAAFLIAIAPKIILLAFGAGFSEAVLPFRILVIGAICASVSRLFRTANIGLGRIRENRQADTLAIFLVVSGNLMLTPSLGIAAAASVTVIANTAHVLCMARDVRQVPYSPRT